MPREGELREANLNGAFLLRRLHRAASDLVTTSDVTPLHRRTSHRYFLIPVFLVGGCVYFLLPLNLFVVTAITSAASFYAHVFFDKEYHVEGSQLQRFAWFRRQQELHFVHHRHANSNFGIIHFFWDKILGTYRMPNAGA
jgi:sterol desaturase/sphingolipid hydroxylase (fatty acid hydroxylase superfamily)